MREGEKVQLHCLGQQCVCPSVLPVLDRITLND